MELTRFEQDGIEILINTLTGESFCSLSGYARMSGLSKQAIAKRCTVNQTEVKYAEIQTASGLQGVKLINEHTISDWIVDDNPSIAKQLLKAGVRFYLLELAGYEVTSTAITDPIDAMILGLQELKKVQAEQKRLAIAQEKQEVEQKRLAVAQEKQELEHQKFVSHIEAKLTLTEEKYAKLEYAVLELNTIISNYQKGLVTQIPRQVLNEMVQKLG